MRNRRLKFLALTGAFAFFAGLACDGMTAVVQAQDVAPAAKAKSRSGKAAPTDSAKAVAKDPAEATRNYASGVIAYQAGRFEAAIGSMNAAVQSGGLPSNLLAKALYYRGAAFQQQNKPGQAIADLTSALWLKGGLDDDERSEATKFRSVAYRDAGLSEQGQVMAASSAAAGQATSASKEQSATGITSSWVATGSAASTPVPVLSAVPTENTVAPPSGLGGLGNLFGNLFGGSPATASAPAETASVPASPQTSRAASAEALPWAARSTPASGAGMGAVSAAGAPAVAGASPSAGPTTSAPASSKKAATKGGYRIQVAAVKSRDEASAVIAQLQSKGGLLASTPASVDQSTFGSSTFFRVRLGPYANAAATKAPCEELKAGGLDCLVTAK